MRARVAMVVMSRYPADPRVRREAEALEATGYAVDIFCLRGADEARRTTYGSVTAYRVMRERDKESVVSYLGVSTMFTLWATVRLLLRSIHTRYDAFQAHSMPDTLAFCGFAHRLRGRPVILDMHDLSVELFGAKWGGKKAKILVPIVAVAERMSCGLATHLISTSPGFTECLIDRGQPPDKITLVLNTADPNVFTNDGDRVFTRIDEGARLLYHGTVTDRFGLHLAVEALVAVREQIPGSTLELYGAYDASYRAALEAQIEELGLGDAVSLGGFKTFEELDLIIKQADIGVVPYLSDAFMQLALSTKTFEYASSGLPVLGSRLQPVESIFGTEAIAFFDPGDADDLAVRLIELCRDPEGRAKRARLAAEVVAGISGPIMAQRYVGLMDDAIGR